MNSSVGKVYLVGAGCGEADLITLRGLECIRRCETLIYDDLIDIRLLAEAPQSAELVYMGKRSGKHSASQEEISAAIVAAAKEGKTVCRLKGGDPFVFGRGGEEILALQEAGIPYEEVPGISSCIAIPAAAGVPVTHRRVARSFHVITAHSADTADGLPEDMDTYAALSGTLIFLMGLGQLEKISGRLIRAGKSPETPAAVISGGNSEHPACVRATLADIAEKARQADVRAPAVIVVGETAAYDFSATTVRPLSGVTVGVTGTEQVSGRLHASLTALGARTAQMVSSRLEELKPEAGPSLLQEATWLVFTSGNGVKRFFRLLDEWKTDIRSLNRCRYAVIGAATKKALSSYGIQADFCPSEYTGAALGAELKPLLTPEDHVVLLRSKKGGQELPDAIRNCCEVTDIATYDTVPDERCAFLAKETAPKLDFLLFSSAGGVQAYRETVGEIAGSTKCICIGPTAAQEVQRLYGRTPILSDTISVEGMIQKVLEEAGHGV